MQHKDKNENQASDLKNILADINAQEKARESLLNDEEIDISPTEKTKTNDKEQEAPSSSNGDFMETDSIKNDEISDPTLYDDVGNDTNIDENESNQNELDQDEGSTDNLPSSEEDSDTVDPINDNKKGMQTLSPLYRKNNDYVPKGHYEKVTDHSDDVVYYDSEQFRKYVQRRTKSGLDYDRDSSNELINQEIEQSSGLLVNDDENVIQSDEENKLSQNSEENSLMISNQHVEINTLNLPPRREVHRKPSRKMTLQVTRPLFRFSLSIMLTAGTIFYLFFTAGEEMIELFRLKTILQWFL